VIGCVGLDSMMFYIGFGPAEPLDSKQEGIVYWYSSAGLSDNEDVRE